MLNILSPSSVGRCLLVLSTYQPQPSGGLCQPLELEAIMLHLLNLFILKSEIILNYFSHVASCFHCLQSHHVILSFLPWKWLQFPLSPRSLPCPSFELLGFSELCFIKLNRLCWFITYRMGEYFQVLSCTGGRSVFWCFSVAMW